VATLTYNGRHYNSTKPIAIEGTGLHPARAGVTDPRSTQLGQGCAVFTVGDEVVLCGLKDADRNGRAGVIEGFDVTSNRYNVKLSSRECTISIKVENMRKPKLAPGQRECRDAKKKAVTATITAKKNRVPTAEAEKQQDTNKNACVFKPGDEVIAFGLSDEARNGKSGVVARFDEGKKRYVVEIADVMDATNAIKAQNLRLREYNEGDKVVVRGIANREELNGYEGNIVKVDHKAYAFVVVTADGSTVRLEREHITGANILVQRAFVRATRDKVGSASTRGSTARLPGETPSKHGKKRELPVEVERDDDCTTTRSPTSTPLAQKWRRLFDDDGFEKVEKSVEKKRKGME